MFRSHAAWFIGLANLFALFREGRRRGYGFWYLYLFGVYRFAFTAMKGSKQTRRMVMGFVAALVGFVLTGVLGSLIEHATHGAY